MGPLNLKCLSGKARNWNDLRRTSTTAYSTNSSSPSIIARLSRGPKSLSILYYVNQGLINASSTMMKSRPSFLPFATWMSMALAAAPAFSGSWIYFSLISMMSEQLMGPGCSLLSSVIGASSAASMQSKYTYRCHLRTQVVDTINQMLFLPNSVGISL